MSNEISKKLQKYFQINHLEHALFYNWQHSLRFELSTGDSDIEMFISAYDRARELLQYTFENSDELHVLIKFYGDILNHKKQPKEMRRLKRCGFKLPETYDYGYFLEPEDSQINGYEYLLPVTINDSNYMAILWAVCSKDLGLQPSAQISAYFIDFKKQVVAHPYDDRGLDIVATEKEALNTLYEDYYHWLLDYDLEIMNQQFGKNAFKT